MSDLHSDLLLRLQEYEIEYLLHKQKFQRMHPQGFTEKALRDYVNHKMTEKTRELVVSNIAPASELLISRR